MPLSAQPKTLGADSLAEDDAAALAGLGTRIRQARARRGMTRRALALHSEVSERYLAHLEGGEGNASFLVLRRVALALKLPLAELVDERPPASIEWALLEQLLKDQPTASLQRIRHQLQREVVHSEHLRGARVALIGLRGAGKSTLGAQVAAHLDRPFIELDREIEVSAGASLEEIFLLYGQAGYRRHEMRCLQRLIEETPRCVIATGGSIVSEPATYSLLLTACTTVWLKASPEEHMARVVAQGDLRPMSGNAEAMDDLRHILLERADRYAQADFTLDTTGKSLTTTFTALLDLLSTPPIAKE
ncbi:MAG: helix-turn-helix domain-containing protein [Gammaproteobacteria bacterium]|nr:helix-turn-helix domain-containing protein [Gammaproteobacteria bacterium]